MNKLKNSLSLKAIYSRFSTMKIRSKMLVNSRIFHMGKKSKVEENSKKCLSILNESIKTLFIHS